MNFREKKQSYSRLRGASHLEADRELLKKLAPEHPLLKRTVFQPAIHAGEILYALIEVASEEDIVQNRRAYRVAKTEETKGAENPGEGTGQDETPSSLAVAIGAVLLQEGKAYEYTPEGFREIPVVSAEIDDPEAVIDFLITKDKDQKRVVLEIPLAKSQELPMEVQQTADAIVAEAESKAAEIVAGAEQTAAEIIAEAETEKKSTSKPSSAPKNSAKKTNTPK